jgi:hypothetical protein
MDHDQLQARLRLHVQRMAAKPRPPQTHEHQAVRGYVTRQLEDAGFLVRVAAHEEAGIPCLNVLSDPLPADERLPLVIVGAGMKSVAGLPVEFIAVPGDGRLLGETRLSDHSSFWDQGFAAVMVTDTSFFRNPHYHKASDTPETLDYGFLAKVTAGVCAAVLQLVGRFTQ